MIESLLNPVSIASLLFLISIFVWWIRIPTGLPPGPISIPLIGCLGRFDGTDISKTYREYRKRYGDVFSFKLGSQLYIVIIGYEKIKEFIVQNGSKLSNRPSNLLLDQMYKHRGIIASNGKAWKENRHFTTVRLKDFGIGTPRQEQMILSEVSEYLSEIESKKGKPFDMRDITSAAICNIISKICFGHRFKYNDEKSLKLLHYIHDMFVKQNYTGLLNFFPFFRYLPFDIFETNSVWNAFHKLSRFLKDLIDKRRTTWVPKQPRDLIDSYLDQQLKEKSESFSEDQMFQVIFDLYLAGTETTAMTILWTILIFVHNPKVQTKMRKEVLERIGNDRLPSLKDQHRMPYSQAVITEVHRYASVIRGIPRASVSDSYIGGYFIPKEALIYVNSESIHYDEDYFENPTTFKPERFLNKDGEFVSNSREFAFGTGKRACLGEILAQAELFLFLTSMLQKFNFEPEDVNSLPTMEPVIGISANPKQFNVRAVQLR